MSPRPVRAGIPSRPFARGGRSPRTPLLLRVLPALALLAVPSFAPPRPANADPAPVGADENPRNLRREGPLLTYLRADARLAAAAPGQRRAFPAGEAVRWYVAPDPGGTRAPLPAVRFSLDGRPRAPVRDGGPGDATGGSVRWTPTPRREELAAEIDGDRCVVATDALTVALLLERDTSRAGDRRFGSLVRRVRASLDALNDLFAASVHPYAPRGVEERFRLDAALVYDRPAGPSSVLADPAAFDVTWILDDDPPAVADPSVSTGPGTIGPARRDGPAAPPPWTTAWEHARWRELLRTRGIPRLEAYAPGVGALPGRTGLALRLPDPFAGDLAAEGVPAPVLSEWTAVVLNQRRGVHRPPPADDPTDTRFGVLGTWLPGRVDLELVRGAEKAVPLAGATVRWWRARRGAGLPEGMAGVAADRAPDGTAAADAAGRVALAGDLLGRTGPPEDRSRWLLLEVEADGARRFGILSALDLSLAYARGAKHAAEVRLEWGRLLVSGR